MCRIRHNVARLQVCPFPLPFLGFLRIERLQVKRHGGKLAWGQVAASFWERLDSFLSIPACARVGGRSTGSLLAPVGLSR